MLFLYLIIIELLLSFIMFYSRHFVLLTKVQLLTLFANVEDDRLNVYLFTSLLWNDINNTIATINLMGPHWYYGDFIKSQSFWVLFIVFINHKVWNNKVFFDNKLNVTTGSDSLWCIWKKTKHSYFFFFLCSQTSYLFLHFQLFYSSVTNKSFENQSSGVHNFNPDIFENINIIRSGRFFLFLRFLKMINSMSERAKIKNAVDPINCLFFLSNWSGKIYTLES